MTTPEMNVVCFLPEPHFEDVHSWLIKAARLILKVDSLDRGMITVGNKVYTCTFDPLETELSVDLKESFSVPGYIYGSSACVFERRVLSLKGMKDNQFVYQLGPRALPKME